jgi:hypothetical protein
MNPDCMLTGQDLLRSPAHLSLVIDFQKSKLSQWKLHRDGYILDVVLDPLRYNKLDGIYYI